MKKSLLTLIAFLFVFAGAFAQTTTTPTTTTTTPTTPTTIVVPKKFPINDEATLIAYALTMVNQIDVQVSGDTVTGTRYGSVPYPAKDANDEKMALAASSIKLRFNAEPSNKLWASANYYGTYGNRQYQLFYGGKQFVPEKSGTSYRLPADAYQIALQHSDWIPFSFPGAKEVVQITEDDKGNTMSYSYFSEKGRIDVNGGIIYLGSDQVGQIGRLIVTMKDNTIAVYNLSTGDFAPTSDIGQTDGFKTSIMGIRPVATDAAAITYQSKDMIVRASYTRATTVTFTLPQTLPELPISVRVVDTASLVSDPVNAGKTYFGPFTAPVSVSAAAGQTLMFIMTYMSEGRPIASSGGKG